MAEGKEYNNLIPPCPFQKGSRGWVAWQVWLRSKIAGEKVGLPPSLDFDIHKPPDAEMKRKKGKPRRKKKKPPRIYKDPFEEKLASGWGNEECDVHWEN